MGRDESMNLSEHQVDAFQRDGFLILPSLFSPAEIEILREALVGPFAEDCPQNFRERGSGFSLILNPVANAYRREQRPDHQHHRDLTPVTALGDDCLREA